MVRWTLNKQLVYSRLICLESPGNLDIRESIVPGKHHAVHVGQAAAWREDAISLEKAFYFCAYIGIGFFSSISFVNLKFKCQIILQARTMSYQQKVIENGNNEEELRKTSLTARPNIKELTHKQRNWFSSFEKNRSGEVTSVDSVRRTSVKNDHTPSLLSGHGSCSPSQITVSKNR